MIRGNRHAVLCRILWVLLALVMFTGSCAVASEVSFAYPKAATKKGLYVTPGMEEDALELGIRHTTLNLSVGDFTPEPALQNENHCYPFSYNGKTYWFSKAAIGQYDRELNRLSQNNVVVTAILLLPYRADLKNLIYPAARNKSANYYQWDMTDAAAVEHLRAIVTFFQRRYSSKKGARIVGWIVGNEVNNASVWNWCGNISLSTYADLYAAQCAAVYSAARKVYKNARIYMCLDHFWSVGNGSYWFAGKKFLTKFAARMSARGVGKGKWNIAYHPYNVDLESVDIMAESAAVTRGTNTHIITMKNLSVLTEYVKKKYTKKCRIILSEQGYTSVSRGYNASAEQAKSVALAYYIAQNNSMVDSLILHRQVDHSIEIEEGGAFGLYTTRGGENALARKPSWTAYKLADTTRSNRYTRLAARQARQVTGRTVKKVFTVASGKLAPIGNLAWTLSCTAGAAGYGALDAIVLDNDVYRLAHETGRNPNVPWGIRRNGRINARKLKKFGFGIQVNGSTNGVCNVTLRLWSGAKRYLETKRKITCQSPHALFVDLKNWKYRGRITRFEILITPRDGRWTQDASAAIYAIGIRK